MTDQEIMEAIQEEAADFPPELQGGLTEEAAIIAQSKDPEDYTELDWQILDSSWQAKPDNECDLGLCDKSPTHYVELLGGRIFFGCERHVDALIRMRIAKKKRKFG